MADEEANGITKGGKSGARRASEVGLILAGLLLIAAAVDNVAVTVMHVPLIAPGALVVQIAFGLAGSALLLKGLDGLWGAETKWAAAEIKTRWGRWRMAAPPARTAGGGRPGEHPARNRAFRNRQSELTMLRHRLARERRMDLSGLGGVGKSQLALEHLHRRRADYSDGIFWVRGDSAATLDSDLAALAWLPQLMLVEREQREQRHVIEAVMRWLHSHHRWLLVVDNLDEAAVPILNGWLGTNLAGHTLVTSRVPLWDPQSLTVEPMPPEIAVALLLERSGQADREAAAVVAEILGFLPLALIQAAGYVKASGRELSSYAQLLRTRLGDVMREGKPEDYPRTVAATWHLSFERIEQQEPAAAALLRLCAFLAPDDIPLTIIRQQRGALPNELQSVAGDEVGLDRAVRELRRYALVDRQGDGLRTHRLVQAVVRDSLADDRRHQWLGAAVRMLEAAFPRQAGDPRNWTLCMRLLPHARVATDLVAEEGMEPNATTRLLDGVASYLYGRGEFALARPFFERALAIRRRVLAPAHPDIALSLNNLAELLHSQHELAPARALFEEAVQIRERVLGPSHPATAVSLDNMARVLWDEGDRSGARSLFERALETSERVLGPDHPATVRTINDLAVMLRWDGQLAAARPLQQRALATRERLLGPDHPDTANSLEKSGILHWACGEFTIARELFQRALEIRERVLGPNHPRTAINLNNLAFLLRDQDELVAGRRLAERALHIQQRNLGLDNPDTAYTLNNLGRLLRSQGDRASARVVIQRAMDTRQHLYGNEHQATAYSINNIARLLWDEGDLLATRQLLEQVLDIRERILGPRHPETAISLNNLGALLRELGEPAAAGALLRRALEIEEVVLGPHHPDTATSLSNLALVLEGQSELATARALHERALAIRERVLGPHHTVTIWSRRHLAEFGP
jgi:tetratricopeptide (TPR) repeat protein